ncbi:MULTISPECIES: bis(5'-nucleosyl)-tetraphosphatase (symmetrical) YqeK [Bacillus]|uniref:bis(5'-nucleosyl)-tetraphosphatase (symmetrical) YqeK n=1 Tax=Bacillus TaxID=1386 RepID=UPI000C77BFA5|nr:MULTISPECIES: bis(5'-nucleosyl)-tetraphosphatase (symmetrical) YqeK [Bacillus]MCA1036305.1 bis(5'-nucleosyl)-tetraphosphatase (symmetrical) YqeK [Bacillus infantis]PLR72703.1 phosphohydrolase [Bacillus sp. UMB0728]
MDREFYLKIVKKQLTEHRYQHTIGVMETAIGLARTFGADIKKAETAAILHDYAKFRPKDEMKRIIIVQKMPEELLMYNSELWHAPAGAYLAETEAGVTDPEILDAIRYHTSGRPQMPLLDKIIYLADYIEPGRHFPGVDEVRKLAETDLDSALIKAMQNTITFLMKKNQPVFPLTFLSYNDLVMKKETD